MNFPQLIFLIMGSIGLGYSLMIIRRGNVKLYNRGEIRTYHGAAAFYIAGGTLAVSFGLLLIGILGFQYLGVALLTLLVYFGARYMANQEVE